MIAEVKETVTQFLHEMIAARGVRVVSINKAEGGWIAEAEVADINQFLASINPDYQVFEKERYIIKLDADLVVLSYKRVGDGE
ncbi:MAG TPA: hypothetical protein VNE61_05195 [Ktedonobacteraceae bacterium]|nr:hypothetical protein [Ktedonobacteraceae bacterium]